MKRRRNKKIQAYVYVALGPIIALLAIAFGIYMYFSGTFLAGMYVARKILYIIMFIICIAGAFAYAEGSEYLKKIRRRRK